MNCYSTTWKKAGLGIIIACAAALLAGCADLQGALTKTTAWRDDAKGIRIEMQSRLDELESQRDLVPDSSLDVPMIDAAILGAKTKINLLDTVIARADMVIEEATNPTDSLSQATNALSPWIPAPAQGPLVLGAALIATFVRSRNLKQSAISIIQSIEHTLSRDPEFRQLFVNHADTIRTIQTPGARKLIDSTLKKLPQNSALI